MSNTRWVLAGMGLLLVLLSVWQLEAAETGLIIQNVHSGDLPVTLMSPSGEEGQERPLVLIGHGVAGSRVIMRGYAITLARAGYNVALMDFAGHGANPLPMPLDGDQGLLVVDAESALRAAQEHGYPINKVAILGHSMGSGMSLSYGVVHPETMATIAVSPVIVPVTPDYPHNLLLLAEELNQRFIDNAEQLLEQAGGPGGDPLEGTARRLVIIPNVEHILILFTPEAHHEARMWLDSTFGVQPGAEDFTDRSVLWYLVGLVGVMSFFWSLAVLVEGYDQVDYEQHTQTLLRRLGAIIVGSLGATFILYLVSEAGLQLNEILGLLVGGYLLVWFAIAGALSLLLLGRSHSGFDRPIILSSLLVFAALWLGVGLLGRYVWLPWLLIPKRLILWPLAVVLTLPWLMAVAQAMLPTSRWGKIGWWFGSSMVVIGSLLVAMRLNPELGFLILIIPLFPLMLGLHALAAGPYRWRTTFALGGSLFIGWLVVVVFPLV